mgnify:CR=1 FL=1
MHIRGTRDIPVPDNASAARGRGLEIPAAQWRRPDGPGGRNTWLLWPFVPTVPNGRWEIKMNEKPEYLYHGSQYKLEILIPQQAAGGRDLDSMAAVYAAETMDQVIPFALPIRWYPDNPGGRRDFACHDGKILLIYGSLDPRGIGYVYKVRADSFEKIDDWQWISRESCRPVEVIEIKVSDYLDRVQFTEEAEMIQRRLFGV